LTRLEGRSTQGISQQKSKAPRRGSLDEKCLEQGAKIAIGRALHKGGATVRQVTPSELWGFTNSLMRSSEPGWLRQRDLWC